MPPVADSGDGGCGDGLPGSIVAFPDEALAGLEPFHGPAAGDDLDVAVDRQGRPKCGTAPKPAESAVGTQSTRIHKFALTGNVPDYTGSVEVPGIMWGGGQRDFRVSEYQGLLRVMTTTAHPARIDCYCSTSPLRLKR